MGSTSSSGLMEMSVLLEILQPQPSSPLLPTLPPTTLSWHQEMSIGALIIAWKQKAIDPCLILCRKMKCQEGESGGGVIMPTIVCSYYTVYTVRRDLAPLLYAMMLSDTRGSEAEPQWHRESGGQGSEAPCSAAAEKVR